MLFGEEVILLFVLFIIKHFIADFPLQTQEMVNDKGTYGKIAGIMHSWVHAVFTTLIVAAFLSVGGMYGQLVALGYGLLDGVIHYHVDWAKMNLGRGLTVNDRMYWMYLGLDQMLHYLTYALIIWMIL